MKLLLYTYDWAPLVGGITTVTMTLARGLAAQHGAPAESAIDLTLVTATPRGDMDDAALPYRVVRQPTMWSLIRLMRQADLVHLAGPTLLPLAISRLLRKKVIVEHHGFQTICPNGQLFYTPSQSRCPGHFMAGRQTECFDCLRHEGYWRGKALWASTFLRRWLCRGVAANVTPTDWLATQLQLPRMTTIHHGIPDDGVHQAEPSPPSRATYAFIGRLVTSKGIPLLIKAMAQLRSENVPVMLKIIGEGPEQESLERMTNELDLEDRVSFLSFVPDDELEIVLSGIIGVVVPAASGEVFGLAAAESMRKGRVPIVPEASAVAEVVGDAGLTFPEQNAQALAAAMKRLAKEPALRTRLSTTARERWNAFFQGDAMVRKHIYLYNRLVV